MSDFKHFSVMHKPSHKIVSIFQIINDATWIGKEKDKLIAIPADTPEEVKEIKMAYVKGFKRYEETKKQQIVSPHFRRNQGQPETLSERRCEGESKAHKLAKNEIYTKLFNGELLINGEDINKIAKDLIIKEESHSPSGNSIADVLIKFDKSNPHPYYGIGINIEVQFSPQNNERTGERTLSRLRDGWSVVWLWKEDFQNGKLKHTNLKVPSREEQLKELREDEYSNFLKKINYVGESLDNKLNNSISTFLKISEEAKQNALNKIEEMEHKLSQDDSEIEYKLNKYKTQVQQIIESISNHKENLNKSKAEFFEKTEDQQQWQLQKYRKEIETIQNNISEVISGAINLENQNLKDYIKEKSKELVQKNFKKTIESKNFSELIKERYGYEIGEFLRINLRALFYEELKKLKEEDNKN